MIRKFNLILKTIYFSELRLRSSDLDMASLREKLDQARMDSLQESEETMAELKNVYEREKLMLMEENKKLQFEYERTVEINNRLQLERRQFEEDYHDLRNKKEAVAQWEAQISEIINWYVFFLLFRHNELITFLKLNYNFPPFSRDILYYFNVRKNEVLEKYLGIVAIL